MIAVILVAGMGSRLRPMTLSKPKTLLPIGSSTILEHMLLKLLAGGIKSFVLVCGYMEEAIKSYVEINFSSLDVKFITNKNYKTTNTGYSLLLAKKWLYGKNFIKLDGDVIFKDTILFDILKLNSKLSYICIDKSDVKDDVIKVSTNLNDRVTGIGNGLVLNQAAGESIGMDIISAKSSIQLFNSLETMMQESSNHQNYYEVAFDEIIQNGEHFRAIDITGLNWVEMDSIEDYKLACGYFG